jgi:serine/threonine protein phosphatase PrpC
MTDVHAPAPLLAAFRTDPGRVRTNNEDLPVFDAARGIYGVIDGIGGQAAGEVAAGIARDVILQRLARPLGTPAERVREAIAIANNEIAARAAAAPDLQGMACVVTLAIVTDGTLAIGHVGDSRLYRIGADGFRKLTHDHSPVGEREDARELTEVEAMRHPRRNEVFRDIGSVYRDKDEDEFVEVVEADLDAGHAILLCSDGLTDMVSSSAILSIVRRFAGDPDAVVDALVDAANDAGGRDNVTVVYAEGPSFARSFRGAPDLPLLAGESGPPRAGGAGPAAPPGRGSIGRRVLRSRTTWFSVGAIAGIGGALLLAWQFGLAPVEGRRTLVVESGGTTGYSRIADAMSVARPGDQIRLEPGVYPERVMLRDGVGLSARIPGTATVTRPSNASGEVVGISVFGSASSSVIGIKVESTPESPLDIGVRVYGQGATLDQLDIAGEMRTGVDILPFAGATVRGSLFSVEGPAVTLADDSQATLTNNTILRVGKPVDAPFILASSSQPVFRRNVFVGFGAEVVKGMSVAVRQQLLAGNFVAGSEPSLLR